MDVSEKISKRIKRKSFVPKPFFKKFTGYRSVTLSKKIQQRLVTVKACYSYLKV